MSDIKLDIKPQDRQIISEADPDFDTKVDPKYRAAVEAAERAKNKTQEQLEKEQNIKPEIRAKYKIEIIFGPNRTTRGPNLAGIHLWESGKRFHGGGDEMMYWCKDNRQDHDDGCWAPIPGDCIRGNIAMCPNCQMAVNVQLLTNLRVVRLTTRKLAEELARMFRSLGNNADIYLKFHKTDVRYQAMMKAKGAAVAERLKGMHIYPLKNILKDTANGADLVGRIMAFLIA